MSTPPDLTHALLGITGEAAGDAILLLTGDGAAIVAANTAACRLAGCTPAEVLALPGSWLGVDVSALLSRAGPGADVAHAVSGGVAAGHGGDAQRLERFRVQRADGEWLTVDARLDRRSDNLVQVVLRDVTEQAGAEGSLRRSREGYRRLMAALHEGVVNIDGAGRIVRMNPRAAVILGLAEGAAKGLTTETSPWAYLRPDGTPFAASGLPSAIVLRTGEPITGVLLGIRRADGVVTWVTVNAVPGRFDDAGHPDEVIVSMADVTALRTALDEVSRSEARVRELVEASGEMILVTDPGGRITYVNPAVTAATGYGYEDLIGSIADDLVDERDRPRMLSERRSGVEGRVRERLIRRADGSTFWVDLRIHPLPTGNDELVARDITERKALEAERDRLALAVEQSLDAVVLADPEQQIRYVNAAFVRIYGYSPEEVVGQPVDFCLSPLVTAEDRAEADAALRTAGRWSGDVLHRTRDGRDVTMSAAWAEVRDQLDAPVGFLGITRDVTIERTLGSQLAQAAKLEAVGQLAGGVAHEFNNILAAIMAHADLAASEPGTPPGLRDDLEAIVASCYRAKTLTSQLLAFGQRSLLRPKPADPASLVADLRPVLSALAGDRIDLRVVASDEPVIVRVDAGAFGSALVGLVANGRDAMPSGGVVRIATGPALPSDDPPDGPWVAVRVSDTGAGMTPDILERALEPFFTTKGLGEATGLGLPMVQGFAAQSGGHLRIASRPGAGTSVTLLLPRLP